MYPAQEGSGAGAQSRFIFSDRTMQWIKEKNHRLIPLCETHWAITTQKSGTQKRRVLRLTEGMNKTPRPMPHCLAAGWLLFADMAKATRKPGCTGDPSQSNETAKGKLSRMGGEKPGPPPSAHNPGISEGSCCECPVGLAAGQYCAILYKGQPEEYTDAA